MFENRAPEPVNMRKKAIGDGIFSLPEGADVPVVETEVSIAQGNNTLNTVAEIRAKRLLQRVQKGESLSAAAVAERMTIAEIRDSDNPVRASLQQLIGSYFLPPEARKQMVRAGLNKMFMDNVVSTDPVAQKVALDAAKQISLDPEVGLAADNSGGVIINIGELESVFSQLRNEAAPEVEDGRNDRRQRENRIVEGIFEDIPAGGSESESLPNVPGGFSTGDKPEGVPSE